MPNLPPVKRFVSDTEARIYRIPCRVFAGLTVRVYLVLGAGPPTLIDAGSGQGKSTPQILAGLEAVRSEFGEPFSLEDVERLLFTHGHSDHTGGAARLARLSGAKIGIHPLDARVLTAPMERMIVGNRRRLEFFHRAGVEPPLREKLNDAYHLPSDPSEPLSVDLELDDGVTLDGIRVIHTPGHSPGHVCLAVGDVVICGDHILARTIPQQWPESFMPYTGLGHYFDSLEKLRRAGPFSLALAGHEPAITNVEKRIDQIRAAQLRRLDRVMELFGESDRPLTIYEVARRLHQETSGFYLVLALADVGARVEFLYQRGRLAVANLDEIRRDDQPPYRYTLAP
jgi:glyoxylase-like metal-dependent hydrolase (beta-lactamase superfamily II)